MERPKLDYNRLAGTYHRRYKDNDLKGIETALLGLAESHEAKDILEVGCGTGRWIEALRQAGRLVFGVDSSTEMVAQAATRTGLRNLVAADANQLPFREDAFDLVFMVNAIHHFGDAFHFVKEAWKLLHKSGVLAVIGIDPRAIQRRYYYDYFEGALGLDLARYHSFGELVDGMVASGFEDVELKVVDRYDVCFTGEEIFKDPFLEKTSNSLLALLEGEIYNAGLDRIRSAVTRDPEIQFRSDIRFAMISGIKI